MGVKDWFVKKGDWREATEQVKEKADIFTGFRFFRKVFGWIIGIIIVALLIGLVIFAIIFLVNVISGGTGGVFVNQVSTALDNVPAGQFLKGLFLNVFGVITNPEDLLTDDIDSNEERGYDKDLGVHFRSFDITPNTYTENIDFMGFARVDITPFEERENKMTVGFECEIEDDACSVAPDYVRGVYGTETRVTTVECSCNSGEAEKEIDGKKVRLKAKYNFLTKGKFKIFVTSQNHLDDARGTNVFDSAGISDSQLNENTGIVTSTYSPGPMKLAIGTLHSQPFTEEGISSSQNYYGFRIKLDNKLGSRGKGTKLNGIKIISPDYVIFDDSDGLVVSSGSSEEGRNVYELSADYIEQQNKPCEMTLGFDNENLKDERCLKLWMHGFLPINLKFEITSVPRINDVVEDRIEVEASYIYEDYIVKDIIVNKMKNGAGDDDEK